MNIRRILGINPKISKVKCNCTKTRFATYYENETSFTEKICQDCRKSIDKFKTPVGSGRK